MSVLRVQIEQSHQQVLAVRAAECLRHEVSKGCTPLLAPGPVALEPVFRPVQELLRGSTDSAAVQWEPQGPPTARDLRRFRIWLPENCTLDWSRSERFLKQLSALRHRAGFEIVGNGADVQFGFLCHRDDAALVLAAFREFDECLLSGAGTIAVPPLPQGRSPRTVRMLDYVPSPPYSHLLTQPDELRTSPYKTFILALAELPPESVGVCQALFQPVAPTHNWHANVEALLDLEFRVGQIDNTQFPGRYLQQAPSASLSQMATEAVSKAHNDKPFFSVSLRIGLFGEADGPDCHALPAFTGLVQHGSRPLAALTEQDYRPWVQEDGVVGMFNRGLTYRPGFLLNSRELTTLVHLVPPSVVVQTRPFVLETLESLGPTRVETTDTSGGTPIGVCQLGDVTQPVCIPYEIRGRHTHVIGASGMGKSSLLEHMVLDDVRRGDGLAVIDPHGDLVQRLLALLPDDAERRTVFLDVGNADWVPLWNPLKRVRGQDLAMTADSLVGVFKNIVTGWGDRLERLLREAIHAVMHLPDAALLDVAEILRKDSDESKRLQERVVALIQNVETRRFWQNDFPRYGKADLFPPQHKIGKLLSGGTVGDMLSQPVSRFDLRSIMDNGQILLVDLSTLGSEVRDLLGSFLLALLHMAALSRNDTPAQQRRPFHIYCDEAHRFVTSAIEDLIAETRKYKVSLTLAHQFRTQFNRERMDALAGTGATVVFNVNKADAGYLARGLRGLADVEDLITLEVGEAVAKIGTEVVRIRTPIPLPAGDAEKRERIVAASRQTYYARVEDVRRQLRRRSDRWDTRFCDLGAAIGEGTNGADDELLYDEFGR